MICERCGADDDAADDEEPVSDPVQEAVREVLIEAEAIVDAGTSPTKYLTEAVMRLRRAREGKR